MKELLSIAGVRSVKGHMCAHNMYATDDHGTALVFKPTGWASNSPHILNEMNKQCSNIHSNPKHYHRHANLENGRAAATAIYPEQLCYSILKGLRAQMHELGLHQLC